eukprot:1415575-Rhodomonas_salina.2
MGWPTWAESRYASATRVLGCVRVLIRRMVLYQEAFRASGFAPLRTVVEQVDDDDDAAAAAADADDADDDDDDADDDDDDLDDLDDLDDDDDDDVDDDDDRAPARTMMTMTMTTMTMTMTMVWTGKGIQRRGSRSGMSWPIRLPAGTTPPYMTLRIRYVLKTSTENGSPLQHIRCAQREKGEAQFDDVEGAVRYAPTRVLTQSAMLLRVCYAVPGTDAVRYAPTRMLRGARH